MLVYKVNPRLVRKQLPPDDDITRRNLLYRQLFHEFDKIDMLRKKEMLERSRLIQQCSITTNPDCLSPEPIVETNKNGFSKCQSSSNIPNMTDDADERNTIKGLSKSISGGNINNVKTDNSNERGSTSSASGVSSPSNNSNRDDEEK